MFRNINNMDALVDTMTGLKEVLIMGNSEQINNLDPEKIKGVVSIGVNRIGLKYAPDVLLWQDAKRTTWPEWESFRDILINTKSPIKICKEHLHAFIMPESPDSSFFQFKPTDSFGHEWEGGLRQCLSIPTAIHLAMVCKIENIYIAGVDYATDKYFWGGVYSHGCHGKYPINIIRESLQWFEIIKKVNTLCKIWMCSKVSEIKSFEFTSRFNK